MGPTGIGEALFTTISYLLSTSFPLQPQPALPLLQLLHPLHEEPSLFLPQLPPDGQPMHFAPRFFALTIYTIAPPRIAPSTIIRIAFSIGNSFSKLLRTLLCRTFLCQFLIGFHNHRYHDYRKTCDCDHTGHESFAKAAGRK